MNFPKINHLFRLGLSLLMEANTEIIWKAVTGYEGLYQVSNTGLVKALAKTWFTGRNHLMKRSRLDGLLRPSTTHDGYKRVTLCNDKIKNKHWSVHRLVAIHFVANTDNKPEVNHKDGDHANNNDWNLEWNTPKENIHHAVRTGLMRNDVGHRTKSVFNTITNEEYPNMKAAARAIGVPYTTLLCQLTGRVSNNTPLIIKSQIK